MSADNGIHITKTELGYEVEEWFGGDDNYSTRGTFPTLEEAIDHGQSLQTEYGLSFDLSLKSPFDAP